jgi:16S rRNA (uracil1498-N3)-methyltransferase
MSSTPRPRSHPPAGPPLAFVADLDRPELALHDRHHLERVLRVRAGDALVVSDGAGRWRQARFGREVEVTSPVVVAPRPEPLLTVAFALVKGGRPELVTQKLTELGVDRIVPFESERSVVRWEAGRASRHHERLCKVAREAAMQSRRSRLPEVLPLQGFDEVVALPGAAGADRRGEAPDLARPCLLVGPEGGWSPSEAARLPARVALGEHVLRAETAAIAGAAVLSALRSGLVPSGAGGPGAGRPADVPDPP